MQAGVGEIGSPAEGERERGTDRESWGGCNNAKERAGRGIEGCNLHADQETTNTGAGDGARESHGRSGRRRRRTRGPARRAPAAAVAAGKSASVARKRAVEIAAAAVAAVPVAAAVAAAAVAAAVAAPVKLGDEDGHVVGGHALLPLV